MKINIVADESVDFRIVTELRKLGAEVYAVCEEQPAITDDVCAPLIFGPVRFRIFNVFSNHRETDWVYSSGGTLPSVSCGLSAL